MKKGFTLIELLAVIIILAIVALIATPIVLDVVEDAKDSAAKSEASMIVSGVNNYCAAAEMKEQLDGTESICKDGVTKEEVETMVDLGNAKVNSITYDSKVTALSVESNDRTVIYNGSEFTIEKSSGETPEPTPVAYKCIRATELHKATCNSSSYSGCQATGYSVGAEITYGNETTTAEQLNSGDAFTCDVNGDGDFDETTERFYYLTDLDTNNEYAVLIYYSNTVGSTPNNTTGIAYYFNTSGINYSGPITAKTNLPPIDQWKNIRLSSNTRAILTSNGASSILQNTGNNIVTYDLPTDFSYEGYAARLVTYQEITSACSVEGNITTQGKLATCNYLMENTNYDTTGSKGYLLENPASSYNMIMYLDGTMRSVNASQVTTESYGVRPVIEVLKTEIDY